MKKNIKKEEVFCAAIAVTEDGFIVSHKVDYKKCKIEDALFSLSKKCGDKDVNTGMFISSENIDKTNLHFIFKEKKFKKIVIPLSRIPLFLKGKSRVIKIEKGATLEIVNPIIRGGSTTIIKV